MRFLQTVSVVALFLGSSGGGLAQDAEGADAIPAADLLTQAELETLVAPVALYPDTLLIQVLVAATQPLEVVKADQFLAANADTDPDRLKTEIEAKQWDASVEVLATAFPDVLDLMALHLDWTEVAGNAMLAQSDDVMTAVQTLRAQAVNTGALVSGEQQLVETDATDNVVIVPADPQVVYVPQYEPDSIWGDVGGAIVTGAVAWGTFALIDEIFDNDDDWDDYWGCRNCGGWGGGPIIRDPNIDIDIDGNVNIGNSIDIDRDKVNIDRDKVNIGDSDIGWKPDPARSEQAKDKIAAKRDETGATTLPVKRGPSTTDDLRARLSAETGARDISGAAGAAAGAAVGAGTLAAINRPSKIPDQAKRDALAKTARPSADKAVAGKALAGKAPATKTAAVKKPAAKAKPAVKKPAVKRPTAISKTSSAPKAKAAGNRGKASSARKKPNLQKR